jgi:DeoR/GlpR family transcriptional regulator of sugar metabolism
LDDSTTVQQMLPHLHAKIPLTAITYSMTLMNELRLIRDITLLGLGGQFQNWCNAFLGPITTAEIRMLRADVVFMSMSAITDGMVFHQSPEMVETKRAMFDSAARRILLADNTKFEKRALHAMSPLEDFDLVIVDNDTPQRVVDQLASRGARVEIAPDVAAV